MTASAIIETPRLLLRVFGPDDAAALDSVHGDAQVMRFSVDGPKTPEQIVRFILYAMASHRQNGFAPWAVIWKETAACIGECGIYAQTVNGQSAFEISYRLRRDFWNRGIATEAASACRDYAFDRLRLPRVISIIEPANLASIRVAEKVGMLRGSETTFHGIPVHIYGLAASRAC